MTDSSVERLQGGGREVLEHGISAGKQLIREK